MIQTLGRLIRTRIFGDLVNIVGVLGFILSAVTFAHWLLAPPPPEAYEIVLIGTEKGAQTNVWEDFKRGFDEGWEILEDEARKLLEQAEEEDFNGQIDTNSPTMKCPTV